MLKILFVVTVIGVVAAITDVLTGVHYTNHISMLIHDGAYWTSGAVGYHYISKTLR